MIKTIFFDVGGVIWKDEGNPYKREISKMLNVELHVLDKLFDKYNNSLYTGKGEGFLEEFGKLGGTKEIYQEAMRRTVSINGKVLDIAKGLGRKYQVGLVSNASSLTAEFNKRIGVYDFFEPLVLSCMVGVKKPDKGIYRIALKMAGRKAEECVIIDDRERNIEPAKELGFHTIHFRNASQLEKDLRGLGLEF